MQRLRKRCCPSGRKRSSFLFFPTSGHKKPAAHLKTHHTFPLSTPSLLPSHETGTKDGGRCSEKDTAVLQHVGRADQSRRCHLRPTLVPPYPVHTGIFQLSEAGQGSPGHWGNRERTVSAIDLSCPTWHSQSHHCPSATPVRLSTCHTKATHSQMHSLGGKTKLSF